MSNHFRITSGDIRIALLEDGTYDVMCWSMPLQGNRRTVMFKQDIPQYIQDALAVLAVCEDGTTIDGVGMKSHDRLFFVENQNDRIEKG